MLNLKIDVVENIIREVADQYIQPYFGHLSHSQIWFKGEDDPVTIADQEAESALSARLLGLLEGSKVVGEEAFAQNPSVLSVFSDDSPVWVIDPLDGTKAFIAETPVYGVIVSLALQNQTVAAWLYDPTSREFVTAERGAGAFYKGQSLSVCPPQSLENMSGIFGRCLFDHYLKADSVLKENAPKINRVLSSCHDYASLVVGQPHFSRQFEKQMHFHATQSKCTPWDMAAGILIHEESGGYSAHWDGSRFKPSTYGRGVLDAPNKESWIEIKRWASRFCTLESC